MNRSLALTFFLTWLSGGSTALAQSPQAEVAARAWAVTDAVLARHVDPPTRQGMLLAGIKAILEDPDDSSPRTLPRLASKVSNLANPDQLAALLAQAWIGSKLDREASEERFFEGLLSVVPGRPTLLSSKERKVNESFEANLYVGVQVALGMNDASKKPKFQQILEGGPADAAGIKADDLIEEVDGVSVQGMPLGKVVDRLRGAEGTQVVVKCSRPSNGEIFTKSLTRSRLPRTSLEGGLRGPDNRWRYRLDDGSPIAQIKIKEIFGSTPRELRTLAEQLESEGMKALILDLREVQSAGFHSTVLLADTLLDGGVIGRVESAEGERVIKAEPDALFRGWPMVVLTAPSSPPEVAWLAQALDANKRATILGGSLANSDPLVYEMVPLEVSDWSVRMPTGRLAKGDGSPLASIVRRPDNFVSAAEVERRTVTSANRIKPGASMAPQQPQAAPFQQVLQQFFPPSTASPEQNQAKAREILEAALKAAGN